MWWYQEIQEGLGMNKVMCGYQTVQAETLEEAKEKLQQIGQEMEKAESHPLQPPQRLKGSIKGPYADHEEMKKAYKEDHPYANLT